MIRLTELSLPLDHAADELPQAIARRLGISAVNAIPPLKDRVMAEARGESGALPRLLQGMTI